MMGTTWQSMREMIADEKARQLRYGRITDYLFKAKEAKSVAVILEMFPDTSKEELVKMSNLGLITYIPQGKYTVFNKAKRA